MKSSCLPPDISYQVGELYLSIYWLIGQPFWLLSEESGVFRHSPHLNNHNHIAFRHVLLSGFCLGFFFVVFVSLSEFVLQQHLISEVTSTSSFLIKLTDSV